MTEESPLFYLDSNRQPDFLTGLKSVTIRHANGKVQPLDLEKSQLKIVEEHPQVDRMEEDWGAICEVYRKKSDYYVTGAALAIGDLITLKYADFREIRLKVVEMEAGQARVERVG